MRKWKKRKECLHFKMETQNTTYSLCFCFPYDEFCFNLIITCQKPYYSQWFKLIIKDWTQRSKFCLILMRNITLRILIWIKRKKIERFIYSAHIMFHVKTRYTIIGISSENLSGKSSVKFIVVYITDRILTTTW